MYISLLIGGLCFCFAMSYPSGMIGSVDVHLSRPLSLGA
jgi:hypothetical protein